MEEKSLVAIGRSVIGDGEVNSVDARELHTFIESKQKFADWVDAKVINNPFFKENTDFIVFRNIMKNTEETKGGRPRVDYALTIDTAKKVAMAEQTAKGNEVRDYFIECEKVALSKPAFQLPDFTDPAVAAIAWAEQFKEKQKALAQIEADRHKVVFAEAVEVSDSLILINDLAKIIKQNGVEMGGRRLFEHLRETGYLCKDGSQKNHPTQKAMELGLFEVKETVIVTGKNVKINITPKVTGKGQTYFVNRFLKAKQMITGLMSNNLSTLTPVGA